LLPRRGSPRRHRLSPFNPRETQSLKFRDMTLGQKAVFIVKLTLSIVSFGFLYPHILID